MGSPEVRGCKTELILPADIKKYDKVPDGSLHADEVSSAQIDCMIDQLIATRNRATRDEFVATIKTKLWETISARLKRRLKNKGLKKNQRSIIKSLLGDEFNQNIASGNISLQSAYDYDHRTNSSPGLETTEIRHIHTLTLGSIFKINIPFRRWRLKSSSTLNGIVKSYDSIYKGISTDGRFRERSSPNSYGLNGSSTLSLVNRKSRYKFTLSGSAMHTWNAQPNQEKSVLTAQAYLGMRKLFGTELALSASAALSRSAWAAPLQVDQNLRKKNIASAHIESSYLFKKAGLVLTYDFEDNDDTQAFYSAFTNSHSAAALAHIRMKKGHARIGLGAGAWKQRFKFSSEDADSEAEGANTYIYAELLWRPHKILRLAASAKIDANRSEGTFNGWYPSWASTLSLIIAKKSLSSKISASIGGHYRDLNEKQLNNNGQFVASISYRPQRCINLKLTGLYVFTKQSIYQPYALHLWNAYATIAFKVFKKRNVWLNLWVGYLNSRYDQHDTSATTTTAHGAWAYLTGEARF